MLTAAATIAAHCHAFFAVTLSAATEPAMLIAVPVTYALSNSFVPCHAHVACPHVLPPPHVPPLALLPHNSFWLDMRRF
eukprot:238198-Chlamydomonas_euryale.AAC.1